MVKTIRFLVTHISPMFDHILRFLAIACDVVKAPLRSVKGNSIKNIHLPLTVLYPVLLMYFYLHSLYIFCLFSFWFLVAACDPRLCFMVFPFFTL